MKTQAIPFLALVLLLAACTTPSASDKQPTANNTPDTRIPVILDTDANNELDDQHAIAYLLFNGDVFDVHGITINRTRSGGEVDKHREEAERVVQLCGLGGKIPIYTGAEANFPEIRSTLSQADFDGAEAVDFIIAQARAQQEGKLVLIPPPVN